MSRPVDKPAIELRQPLPHLTDSHPTADLTQAPASVPDLPSVEHLRSAIVRIAIGLVWLGSAWTQRAEAPGLLWVCSAFLVYATAMLALIKRNISPERRMVLHSVVDVIAITFAVYWYGSISSYLVFLYVPMIAAHSIDRFKRIGPAVLWLSIGGWVAVVALEALGVLPARPGGPGELATASNLADALLAAWPAPAVMLAIYFVLAPQVVRIRQFVQKERRLIDSEKHAQVRARRLQRKLVEAQRLESLGRLAGGVAHDFNNLLTAILGLTNLVYEDLDEDDDRRNDLLDVIHAAERAAELTSQLLAFSRRQLIEPRPVDVNELLGRLERMLGRIIGEDIAFNVTLAPDAGIIVADPSQVEQVIVNLVVNSRDAMPEGGELAIDTRRMTIDEEAALDIGDIDPGEYVVISVTDSGIGMDPLTRARIFDPFFTTKELGKGTGLGLATVYGIVRQNDGAIIVDSAVGAGTRFTVFWPSSSEVTPARAVSPMVTPGGRETILLVEDEEIVRSLAARILESAGYRVLPCADANEALESVELIGARIHLLLTDVVIPQMSGKALADRISQMRPGVRVVFMSGYADEQIGRHGVLSSNTSFIAKPFTAERLLAKVREVLDRKPQVSDQEDTNRQAPQ